jgi:hypothetical protein
MPSSLISFLQANPNCTRADLFAITLPTGTTFYATDGQFDITVPSGTNGWAGSTTTFSTTQYGRWKRGAITSEASFNLQANTMALTCVPQQGTQYPGIQVGLLNAALNHLFEPAQVKVYTAYMPSNQYGNVSNGIETKWFGYIVKINDINRTEVVFDCGDPNFLASEKVPKRLIQTDCPWSYGDSNCNPVGGIKQQTFTCSSATTTWTVVPSSVTGNMSTAGFYTQGVIKCTIGKVAGLSQTVKLHASGTFTLDQPWIVAPAAGDTFIITAGCDKTVTTCDQKHGNKIHFGGMFDVPVPITGL